ncbi:hypothetical protein AMJ80_11735 [bacterium SM23_31]|nr:MAG: hypothetical protein AMJ80_11735 [bacterium SM23_31]
MLDEQFFSNEKFHPYVNSKYVAVRAVRGEESGDALYEEYNVRATPTVAITQANGTEIDRVIGYSAPPEGFMDRLEESLNSETTFANLLKGYNENPDDLKAAYKLASKYNDTYRTDQANELFEKILTRPDEAKKIMVPFGSEGEVISIYEQAKFTQGNLDEFIEEFPDSKLARDAYTRLARTHSNGRDVEKDGQFFNKMLEKYPEDINLLKYFVTFCVRSKTDVERGLKIAEKINTETGVSDPAHTKNYAELLALSGDNEKLNRFYGKSFADRQRGTLATNLYNYASFWISRKENLEDALAKARMVVELRDGNPSYRSRVAQLFIQAENLEGAMEIYGSEFVNDYMSDARILYSYASFWGRQEKNLESALEAAKKSVELDPQPNSYDALSLIYWKSGKLNEAIKAEEKALELSPENARYLKRIEDIKKEIKK